MGVYTKTGDHGTTSLIGGTRISKADLRLDAYGTSDELNSYIGWLRAKVQLESADDFRHIDDVLRRIQNKLFNLGGYLALDQSKYAPSDATSVAPEEVTLLEQEIDAIESSLDPVHSFILPGGSETIAICHVCRTVARRLERHMVALFDTHNMTSEYDDVCLQYVNRLSDYLFVLSKKIAKLQKNALFLWEK